MIHGGTDTGWTFYTPYSTTTPTTVFPVLLGVFILGFSSILTGLNFIVTIHTLRAPGMALDAAAAVRLGHLRHQHHPGAGDAGPRPHASCWSASSTRSALRPLRPGARRRSGAVPAPVLVLLAPGRLHHDAAGDGRDLARSSPPSRARTSSATRRSPTRSLGIAFVGFFTWGHHMFVSGQSSFDAGAFGVLSMLVGVFTAIKVFTWVGDALQGRHRVQRRRSPTSSASSSSSSSAG